MNGSDDLIGKLKDIAKNLWWTWHPSQARVAMALLRLELREWVVAVREPRPGFEADPLPYMRVRYRYEITQLGRQASYRFAK